MKSNNGKVIWSQEFLMVQAPCNGITGLWNSNKCSVISEGGLMGGAGFKFFFFFSFYLSYGGANCPCC